MSATHKKVWAASQQSQSSLLPTRSLVCYFRDASRKCSPKSLQEAQGDFAGTYISAPREQSPDTGSICVSGCAWLSLLLKFARLKTAPSSVFFWEFYQSIPPPWNQFKTGKNTFLMMDTPSMKEKMMKLMLASLLLMWPVKGQLRWFLSEGDLQVT